MIRLVGGTEVTAALLGALGSGPSRRGTGISNGRKETRPEPPRSNGRTPEELPPPKIRGDRTPEVTATGTLHLCFSPVRSITWRH